MSSTEISQLLAKRRSFYAGKLSSYEEWSSKRSEMNETPLKYIRKMLLQMLKELSIPSSSTNSILNAIYGTGYDATGIVSRVSEKKGDIFDILSKDSDIRIMSVEASLYAMDARKIGITHLNNIQLAGLCVFIQFILSGGRSECEGFGASPDLINMWKKISRDRKIQEQQKKTAEQRKTYEDAVKKAAKELAQEEEEQIEQKLEPSAVVDSWEDL